MSIRISNELRERAEKVGKVAKRSIGKQIEYWSELGDAVGNQITLDEAYLILMGRARISVELVAAAESDAAGAHRSPVVDVLAKVATATASEPLVHDLGTRMTVVVEADPENKGAVRYRNTEDGSVLYGHWQGGKFVSDAASNQATDGAV